MTRDASVIGQSECAETINHVVENGSWGAMLDHVALLSVSDTEGRVLFLTPAYQRMLNASSDTPLGQTREALGLHAIGHVNWPALVDAACSRGIWQGEMRFEAPGGVQSRLHSTITPMLSNGRVWLMEMAVETRGANPSELISLQPISSTGAEAKVPGFLGAAERKVDMALLEPQQLMESILSSLPEQVLVLDSSGSILLTNSTWERYRVEHAVSGSLHTPTMGDNFLQFLIGHTHPSAALVLQGVREVMEMRKLQYRLEYRDVTRDEYDWFALKVTPWLHEGGGVVMTQTNISAAKRLSAEHERLITLAENTPDLISICDLGGKLTYMNQAARDFHGSGLMQVSRIPDVHRWLDNAQELLRNGGRWAGESTLIRRDGTEVPVLMVVLAHVTDMGELSHISCIARDISELRRNAQELEERNASLTTLNEQLKEIQGQLLQSEKMASIGQLAAGVAHEINNPIGYVNSNLGSLEGYLNNLFELISRDEETVGQLGNAELVSTIAEHRRSADYDFLREDLELLLRESREGITRVRKIVQDLKDFSRVDNADSFEFADLNKGLDSTLNIVQNEIKYKADVIKEYGELPAVECLLAQLGQVFLNMLVNASHAITGFGKIWIRTRQVGEEVCVEFEDTGCGIEPKNLSRIFDPFFTTKDVGIGTGLGLSLSYGIIQKHRGRIEVDSTVGSGTRFSIWLPIRQDK